MTYWFPYYQPYQYYQERFLFSLSHKFTATCVCPATILPLGSWTPCAWYIVGWVGLTVLWFEHKAALLTASSLLSLHQSSMLGLPSLHSGLSLHQYPRCAIQQWSLLLAHWILCLIMTWWNTLSLAPWERQLFLGASVIVTWILPAFIALCLWKARLAQHLSLPMGAMVGLETAFLRLSIIGFLPFCSIHDYNRPILSGCMASWVKVCYEFVWVICW